MTTARMVQEETGLIKYLAGADIVADQIIILNTTHNALSRIGIARGAIANGSVGIVATQGVYRFPKVSGAVIKAGETVNWDASESAIDDNAATSAVGDLAGFGMAVADAGNGTTTVDVDIEKPGIYDGSDT